MQYGIRPDTGEIDYAQVERLANEHRPKMIIAGFSAYSRVVDWARFAQIARELAKTYPAEVVDEALKRLIDRRYIVAKRPSSPDAAAAYWATLGLPLDVADKNLKTCRVRVQSLDAKGGKELGAALKKLGVRVVDRTADLTVVLTNDYLDGRLEALNKQHLSDGTPWLLVQASGVFPLVGPVLRPDDGPCWTCLAERMKRNREVRAMLDRRQARPVAVSPLARDPVGGSGLQLAAVEIAKAIAAGFRGPLPGFPARHRKYEETFMEFGDLRGWIAHLAKQGELHEVTAEVDWDCELGTITRRAFGNGNGPALLFNNIKDYQHNARCTQLFTGGLSNYSRVALMFGLPKDASITNLVKAARKAYSGRVPPVRVATGPVKENIITGDDINLFDFPVPRWHRRDGGRTD